MLLNVFMLFCKIFFDFSLQLGCLRITDTLTAFINLAG